ncbi:hypothetical protein ABIC65_000173 [Sphingomonas trueperi]|uniref:hypothetical protein n=1 Tax=Sphingomonas trueperi TaxID=53317 RepID=UPI003398C3DE
MTRVLIWNIQQFSVNKIFSASTAVSPGHGGLQDQVAAQQRRSVINYVLNATQPDIIVIVEVSSGENIAGDLATPTGGLEAIAHLQYRFNQFAGTPGGWNAVPPLYIGTGGRAETIGILYRRTNDAGTISRYFTGPNIWTGGTAGASVRPGMGAPLAAPYTGIPLPIGTVNINGMLVPHGFGGARQIPAAALHNAGVAENLVAARVNFDDGTGNGTDVDFAGLRQPYMATFTEANTVGGAIQRDLTLFAIHSPPNNNTAAVYINVLAALPDVVGPLGANETRIIGGDFNINLLAGDGSPSGAYNPLTNAPNAYSVLLNPTAAGAPANLDQYRGYFSTHIRGKHNDAASLFLWSDGIFNPSYYPGYGYVGSDFTATPVYSIDNVLVWPLGGHNYETTVMNLVTGTPLNAVGVVADNPPQGTIVMPPILGNPPIGWPFAPVSANYPGIAMARMMTGWNNYGRLRNTSDHFGIYVTV